MVEMNKEIAVIITTKNRIELLFNRSLPSIRNQNNNPALLVIVNDGKSFSHENITRIESAILPIKTFILNNMRKRGYSGATNTGIEYLKSIGFSGFISFLDDDDEWDPNHLEENYKVAKEESANIVISGLRYIKNGRERPRNLITEINFREFIIGNPGWQGSNTFIHSSIIFSIGGFKEDLMSMNDRDIAIRLLRRKDVKVAFTNKWTANWYIDNERKSLSTPRCKEKIEGLKLFWELYNEEMTDEEKKQYFQRAEHFFGFNKWEIISNNQ
jgi:glycosyltransferase involved in cell wall biosynthesis